MANLLELGGDLGLPQRGILGRGPGAAASSLGELAREVGEGDPNTVLSNVGRWLGRLGFATRALMLGDPEAAAKNLFQFGLDFPTGGFVDKRLSLAGLLPEDWLGDPYDLTAAAERPEFSDVLRPLGLRPRGELARVAVDVAGGIVTDPLSYVTLGGGGIARGGVTGLTRTGLATRVLPELKKLPAGQAALRAQTDDALRRALGLVDAPLIGSDEASRLGQEALRQATEEASAKALHRGEQALAARAGAAGPQAGEGTRLPVRAAVGDVELPLEGVPGLDAPAPITPTQPQPIRVAAGVEPTASELAGALDRAQRRLGVRFDVTGAGSAALTNAARSPERLSRMGRHLRALGVQSYDDLDNVTPEALRMVADQLGEAQIPLDRLSAWRRGLENSAALRVFEGALPQEELAPLADELFRGLTRSVLAERVAKDKRLTEAAARLGLGDVSQTLRASSDADPTAPVRELVRSLMAGLPDLPDPTRRLGPQESLLSAADRASVVDRLRVARALDRHLAAALDEAGTSAYGPGSRAVLGDLGELRNVRNMLREFTRSLREAEAQARQLPINVQPGQYDVWVEHYLNRRNTFRETVDSLQQIVGPMPTARPPVRVSGFGGDVQGDLMEAAEGELARRRALVGQDRMLDAGLRALEERRLVTEHGSLRLSVPFGGDVSGPLVSNVWGKIGALTAPGLTLTAARALPQTRRAAIAVETAAAHAWNWAKHTLYSKDLMGWVPEGLRDVVREFAGRRVRDDREAAILVDKLWGGFSPTQRIVIGRAVMQASDMYHEWRHHVQGLAGPPAGDTPLEATMAQELAGAGGLARARRLERAPRAAAAQGLSRRDPVVRAHREIESAEVMPQARRAKVTQQTMHSYLDNWRGLELQRRQAMREMEKIEGLLDDAAHADRVRLGRSLIRQGRGEPFPRGGPVAVTEEVWADQVAEAHLTTQHIAAEERLGSLTQARDAARQTFMQASGRRSDAFFKALLADNVVATAARELGVSARDLEKTLGAYFKAMEKLPQQLTNLKVWSGTQLAEQMPFYIPFQADDVLAEYIPHAVGNDQFRTALRDVFTRKRQYRTTAEFRKEIERIAHEHGVPVPEGGVMDEDIGALMFRRLVAHNRTVERSSIYNEATKRFRLRQGDRMDRYLQHQLQHLPRRESILGRILGGGEWEIDLSRVAQITGRGDESLRAWAREQVRDGRGRILVDRTGRETFRLRLPGLNAFYKPALTIFYPAFHVRNALSAVAMSFLDPDVGLSGAKGVLGAMWDGQILNRLRGGKHSDRMAARIIRAAKGDESALAQLEASGERIGKWNAAEVVRQARQGLLQSTFSESELFELLDDVPMIAHGSDPEAVRHASRALHGRGEKVSGLARWPARAWRGMTDLGARIASHVEDSFRMQAYMGLVAKGVDPTEAIRRVKRAYVDYRYNSVMERWLRDTLPFIRYTIGITPPVLAETARRPRTMLPLARIMGSQATDDRQAFLPEHVRETTAIPFRRDDEGNPQYIAGLGLPQEVGLGTLGMIPTPGRGFVGARRGILAAITPPLRTPLEATTGVSFYFGDRFGRYQAAPQSLQRVEDWTGYELTQRSITAGGVELRKVPGWVNSWLIGATPASRFVRTLDRALDRRRQPLENMLNTFSGVQIRSVDQEREARKVLETFLREAADDGDVGSIEVFFEYDGRVLPPRLEAALEAHQSFRRPTEEERLPRRARFSPR